MVSRTGFSLLVVLLIGASAMADDSLTDKLVALEDRLIQAIGDKDGTTIADLLAHESYSITASRGRRTTEEVIRDLEHLRYDSYEIRDATAIPVTDDVAILSYTFSYKVAAKSSPITVYATSTWKRTGNQWDSIFYQETPKKK